MTVKKGDRITLRGVVERTEVFSGDGLDETRIVVRLDGDDEARTYPTAEALAHATIEPRPLAVGDRVRCKIDAFTATIRAVENERAWLLLDDDHMDLRTTRNLSDLTRIDGDRT